MSAEAATDLPVVKLSEKAPPSKLALGAAAVALVGWIVLAVLLVVRTGADEVQWARLTWVFSSVEAVAFAAAGLLFGTTVNRQRAEKAEARADENQEQAEAGRALAAVIKLDEVEGATEKGGPERLGGPQSASRAADIVARHSRLARQLFP